jgi:serine O-acetyltransferase
MKNFLQTYDKAHKFLLDFDFSKHPDLVAANAADAAFIYENDPSIDREETEVLTAVFAIKTYRIANMYYRGGMKTFARTLTEYAKSMTGIDIHPAAQIGVPFAIDHGVGVVIGQTAVIGNHCMLYHGVTLGAKHLSERDQVGVDRHPKLGNNIIIYSNTTILGNIKIPDGLLIGANKFIKSEADIAEIVDKAAQKRAGSAPKKVRV